jgi:hypothetical protein
MAGKVRMGKFSLERKANFFDPEYWIKKGGSYMKKMLIAAFVALTLIATSMLVFVGDGAYAATEMVVDVIVARPLGLVAIVLGSAVFIVALPFAAISGSVEPVGRTLVAEPCKFTFTRPVGDFSCWE